jgi:hypothetical protein
LLGLIGVAVWFAAPWEHHITGWLYLSIWACLVLLVTALVVCARRTERFQAEGWVERLTVSEETSHVMGNTYLPTEPLLPGSQAIAEPIPPSSKDIRVKYATREERYVGDPEKKAKLQLVGVAIDTIAPRVVSANLKSETTGVFNRLLLETPEPTSAGLDRFQKFFWRDKQMARFIERKVTLNEEGVRAWCSKYPSARAAELFRAWKEVAERGRLTREELSITAFVKMEKKVDVGLDGVLKPATPRMVCAHEDAVLVLTCPLVGVMYEQLRQAMDGSGPYLFASGHSAEYVGSVMKEWYDNTPDPVVWCVDATKLDAHIREHFDEEWKRVLWFKEIPPLSYQAFCENGGIIRTPHGLRVDVPPHERRLWSGEGDTNLKGSVMSIATIASGDLCQIYGGKVMVTGDDGAGVVSHPDPDVVKRMIEEQSLENGIQHTAIVSRDMCDIDFCSKLFWPVEGDSRWVLGAKPGRMISRIGYVLVAPNEPNLKGIVYGLLNDNYHVPVLGHMLRHLNKLLTKEKVVRGRSMWEGLHVEKRHECDDSTWAFFRRRYECTQVEADELVNLLTSVTALPVIVTSPLLERMVKRDD